MTTAPVRVPLLPPRYPVPAVRRGPPPITYCPMHGGALRFCHAGCFDARWEHYYWAGALKAYFRELYGHF
jgi:hypothetical protein